MCSQRNDEAMLIVRGAPASSIRTPTPAAVPWDFVRGAQVRSRCSSDTAKLTSVSGRTWYSYSSSSQHGSAICAAYADESVMFFVAATVRSQPLPVELYLNGQTDEHRGRQSRIIIIIIYYEIVLELQKNKT